MVWPFKRKPKPTPPPINDDWAVGDLAECMVNQIWNDGFFYMPGPAYLEIRMVTDIKEGFYKDHHHLGLAFARWPGKYYTSTSFRKITPRADEIERADAEFLKSLHKEAANV